MYMFCYSKIILTSKALNVAGAAPSTWRFYTMMDNLLGARPNVTALEHGIDGDQKESEGMIIVL